MYHSYVSNAIALPPLVGKPSAGWQGSPSRQGKARLSYQGNLLPTWIGSPKYPVPGNSLGKQLVEGWLVSSGFVT